MMKMKVQIIKTRMRVRIKMRMLGKSRKWEELEVGRVGCERILQRKTQRFQAPTS